MSNQEILATESMRTEIRRRWRIRALLDADFAAHEAVIRKTRTGEIVKRIVNRPSGWIEKVT